MNSAPSPELTTSQVKLMRMLRLIAVYTTVVTLIRFSKILSNFSTLVDLKGYEEIVETIILLTVALLLSIVSTIILCKRNGSNLHPDHAQKALDRVTNAVIVHISTRLLSDLLVHSEVIPSSNAYFTVLGLIWAVFWILACCSLAKAKGYHPIWGVVGIFNLSSTLLLSLLPDRRLNSADS
ncbi:hypothetical protein H6G89_08510 [Oscillatoria sp. FACHB-1407]|uniref:hypothetical protein n=1 Tax=Oscillatoria sp. FACHB-1407 TaxID=2692847 RepID=UPI0016861E5C|nr:hypothetical protein [Oscillatoria sp. FACHB-1407]MBD2461082.1 hypothetical protein [Oscillatoria sp. FACHB-1407]